MIDYTQLIAHEQSTLILLAVNKNTFGRAAFSSGTLPESFGDVEFFIIRWTVTNNRVKGQNLG